MKATNAELISLVAGELDANTLAARHGVDVETVGDWRAAFLAGMRAAEGARVSRTRWGRVLVAGCVVIATVALAQTLTPMTPDTPARADEVNGNFTLLKQWLEAKVGAVGPGLNPGTGNITTTGSISGSTLFASGSITSGGAVTATSNLTAANGDVRMGAAYAPRADENLRIVRGTVTAASPSGTGFTSTGGGTTTQTITFTRPFSATPTVVCNVGPGAASADACNFVSISTTGFVSTTGIRNAQFTPANITFIAVGPN